MALYLLIRDHKAHVGAIEVGWRTGLLPGFHREGDVIFAYHVSVEHMLAWARHPARDWKSKIPLGIIDVRDTWIPEHKLFASVPVLDRVEYHMLAPVGEIGGESGGAEPGDPDHGMWIARDTHKVTRRQILTAAIGAPDGSGSVRDRLQRQLVESLNIIDNWALKVESNDNA